jgi:hypothetical protein
MKTTPQNRSLRSRFRGDPGMKTTPQNRSLRSRFRGGPR